MFLSSGRDSDKIIKNITSLRFLYIFSSLIIRMGHIKVHPGLKFHWAQFYSFINNVFYFQQTETYKQ